MQSHTLNRSAAQTAWASILRCAHAAQHPHPAKQGAVACSCDGAAADQGLIAQSMDAANSDRQWLADCQSWQAPAAAAEAGPQIHPDKLKVDSDSQICGHFRLLMSSGWLLAREMRRCSCGYDRPTSSWLCCKAHCRSNLQRSAMRGPAAFCRPHEAAPSCSRSVGYRAPLSSQHAEVAPSSQLTKWVCTCQQAPCSVDSCPSSAAHLRDSASLQGPCRDGTGTLHHFR